ncbi:MAG: sigma-70 family RNA polymerase sigma factor [Planctomycetota bacterium]
METNDLPKGRSRTYEQLLEKAEPTMRAVVYSQIYCPGHRADTLQECRIDLWMAHQAYADELFSPKGLGRVIARRRCTKHRKKAECRAKHEQAYGEALPRTTRLGESDIVLESTVAEEAEVLRKVFGVIFESFTPTQRKVFEAFFLEGLTYRQIADRYGWKAASSAYYYIKRSIITIKDRLSDREMDCLEAFCPSCSIDAGRWLGAA